MLSSMSRKETTETLTCIAGHYLRKKRYSTYAEIGCIRRARLRADVAGLNMKGEIVFCEVKSCWQDFQTDKKWHKYLEYCNKFYFVFDAEVYAKYEDKIKEKIKGSGAGVIVVRTEAYENIRPSQTHSLCRVVSNAKRRDLDASKLMWLLTKMAWRGGMYKVKRERRLRKIEA